MNARINSAGIGRPQSLDPAELAEIHSVDAVAPLQKSRPLLSEEEEAISLPAMELPVDPLQLALKQFLGPALTSDNPVWKGDPVPSMRGLQRMMVEHSLGLAEGPARTPMMAALRHVEMAVQMRLRWLQMKRSETESTIVEGEAQDAPEKNR